MTEEMMKELLFSLAWYDCSNYHNTNAREILARAFPGADFKRALDEFNECKTAPPGEGCPR